MKCALSIKFCLFGVTLVKMFALPKINRETPQSPTSRLLHCQFITDLLLVVGQMLEGLLVQTCFSQHLVLVEQQLAVLVVHFVRRRLNRPEKEQTTLSVSNILYQAHMTENLQEPLCFSGNSELFSVCVCTVTPAHCITQMAQRQEAGWSYQEHARVKASELYCCCDQCKDDRKNTHRLQSYKALTVNQRVRHLQRHKYE